HDHGELIETALGLADANRVLVATAVDDAHTEQGPALRIECGGRWHRGRHRARVAGLLLVTAVQLDVGLTATGRVRVDELDLLDHAVAAGEVDRAAALTFLERELEIG